MIRISQQKTRSSDQAGFSLVEILVVIGLMALIMSIAVPNFGRVLKINLSNSTRELANTIRATHDEAVLKGEVYRLAFDIEKSQYWTEIGERGFLMRSAEQEEEARKRLEKLSKEEREKKKEPFSLAKAVTKKKLSLPKGVKFSDITTSRDKEPSTTGVVYSYVFPHGFIEKTIIHLKDDFDRQSTVVVNSVTGKSWIFERYVKESELN